MILIKGGGADKSSAPLSLDPLPRAAADRTPLTARDQDAVPCPAVVNTEPTSPVTNGAWDQSGLCLNHRSQISARAA